MAGQEKGGVGERFGAKGDKKGTKYNVAKILVCIYKSTHRIVVVHVVFHRELWVGV